MIDKFKTISGAAKQIMNARMPDSNQRPNDHEITLKEKNKNSFPIFLPTGLHIFYQPTYI